jgi:hypothetical protein
MHPGDLKSRCYPGCNERRRNKILALICVQIKCSACDCQRGRYHRPNHGQGVLQAQYDGEENWYLIVESIEWCFMVLVSLV